jgi:hypothetical protein
MKNLNSYFVIGITGMIATAVLHIMSAAVIADTSLQSAFFTLYPAFLTFLVIGTRQMVGERSATIKQD